MLVLKRKTALNIYSAAFCMMLLAACGKSTREQPPAQRLTGSANSEDSSNINLARIQQILDSIVLLRRPTAGLAEINGYDVPVVAAINLESSDVSFDVFRCSGNQAIQGKLEEYDPDHPALSKPTQALEYLSSNDFWNDISKNCVAVKSFHPQRELTDVTAPSGDWIWFLRPCIATGDESKKICSRMFASSTALQGYHNRYSLYQQELLFKIQTKLQLVSEITAGIPSQSSSYLAALEKCGNDNWDKATRALMKSLVLNIIGMGSSIIFEIFAPTANSKGSWREKVAVIWQPSDDVQKTGQALTRVLLWLFSNQNEYKKTCSAAEEIRISANAALLRLKSLQYELAADLDEAERAEIPLPAEVRP